MKKVFSLGIILLTLVACAKQEVSYDTLEEQKTIARENAMFNAKQFRKEDPRLQAVQIVQNGDSSQLPDCPQGDGWATLKFIFPDGQELKIKCSTYSGGTGCLTDTEFKTKSYAGDDGQCQNTTKVPFPLPKIAS